MQPEDSGHCGIPGPWMPVLGTLRSLRPWSQGKWGGEVRVAGVGGCWLKTEGCGGWGRL